MRGVSAPVLEASPRAEASAPEPARAWRHVPSLDGLRGVAVLLVLAYHALPARMPGGFVGVDVFFVLSGFLITALLCREREESGRIRLKRFWTHRVRRLVPALLIVLVVSSALTLLVGRDTGAGLRVQVAGALTWTSNWVQIHRGWDYTEQHVPPLFNHLWSLGIEEQFYLVWPLVIMGGLAWLGRRWSRSVIAVLAVASAGAYAAWYLAGDGNHAYMGLEAHAFGLLLGAALALSPNLQRGEASPLLGRLGFIGLVGVLAFAVFVPWNSDVNFLGGLALANIAAALVLVAALRPSAVTAVLATTPLRWVGERSYGLYLWHWPLIVFAVRMAPAEDAEAAGVVALVVALAAATLSYRFVEMPMRRQGIGATLRTWGEGLRAGMPAARVRRAAVAGALTTTIFAGAALAQSPAESELESTLRAGQALVVDSLEDLEVPEPSPAPPPVEPARTCAPVPVDAPVTAFGDSVTVAVTPALIARRPGTASVASVGWQYRDVAGAVRQAAAAGQLQGTVVIATGTNGQIDQADLNALVTNELLGRQVALVVPHVPGRSWADQAVQAVHAVAAANDHVHLVDWNNYVNQDPSVTTADRVHPNAAGQNVFADLVGQGLQQC